MSNVKKCHEMSNVKKCHEMSNVMKCQESWNVKSHEMSNVMKCQMSWNVKCHEMSNITKCWCWCWIYDPTSRNTRSYTLWSVPSSPQTIIFRLGTHVPNYICPKLLIELCHYLMVSYFGNKYPEIYLFQFTNISLLAMVSISNTNKYFEKCIPNPEGRTKTTQLTFIPQLLAWYI